MFLQFPSVSVMEIDRNSRRFGRLFNAPLPWPLWPEKISSCATSQLEAGHLDSSPCRPYGVMQPLPTTISIIRSGITTVC